MRQHSRRATAWRALAAVVLVTGAAAAAFPSSSSATSTPAVRTDPGAGERVLSPLTLTATFPGPGGSLSLIDDEGHELPPTGAGIEVDGNRLVFHNPDLEPGLYTLQWSYEGAEGSSDFIVDHGQPGFVPLTRVVADEAGINPIPAVVGGLLAALLLVALRRRLLIALPLALLILTAGAATSWAFSQERPSDLAACVTLGNGWGGERLQCATDWVLDTSKGEPQAVIAAIRSVSAERGLGQAEDQPCHNISHKAGRSLANDGADVAALAAADPGLCAWGLTHGALERKAVLLSDAEWGDLASKVCAPLSADAAIQCAHGVGHASALRSNSNLPYAYSTCEPLADLGPRLEAACVEGATMNWSFRLQFAARGSTVDRSILGMPQTPFIASTCPKYEGETRTGCWRGAFLYLAAVLESTDPDLRQLPEVLSFCKEQSDDLACIHAAMYHAGDFPRAIPVEESAAACAALQGDQRHVCMQANVNGWVNRGVEEQRENSAVNRNRRCAGFAAGFSDADRAVCAGPDIMDPITLLRRSAVS